MTTIICDGKTIFADSRGYTGDKTPIGTKRKVHRFEYGIFGCSSVHPGVPEQLFALLKTQGPYARVDPPFDGEALFLQNDGQVFFYSNGPGWVSLEPGQIHCIGSGAQYAYGALKAGASPQDALAIAIGLDVWSGMPIYAESIA